MNIEIGWYRTRRGARAYIAVICPHPDKIYSHNSYAIGWWVHPDNKHWVATSWSADGTMLPNKESEMDLVSRDENQTDNG